MKLNQLKSGLKGLFAVAAVVLASGAFGESGELPEGYKVVDYIVAPAGSYIDTDYWPSDKTRVAMDVTVQGAREYWFGAWINNWNNGVYALGNDQGAVYCGYGSGSSSCGGIKGPDGSGLPAGRVTVALEKGVVYTNDVIWSDAHSSGAEFTVNYNLYLFAQNRKGTATPGDGQGDIICHGCKISEGSVVKRDFVPCVREADGLVGLYDKVNGNFYVMSGSLPEGYESVEYIESFRGAYIDTEYHPTLTTRIVADFNPLETQSWGSFFGVTENDQSPNGILMRYYDTEDKVNGWFCNDNYHEAQIEGVANKRIQVELKAGGMTANGTSATITTTGTPYDGSIYLFSVNCKSKGGTYRTHAMRLYSFRIYETVDGKEKLVRNFVPCVRTEDDVAGLYDVAERKFYGNVGGGGFVVPVSESELPCGRTLSSGTYEFTRSVAFVAPNGESALSVADGANVTLRIPAGVTVMLRGGDANYKIGAGAGIEVPENATLTIQGAGKLYAYGGKAANGYDGGKGTDAFLDDYVYTSGCGGDGGFGGGGAGAGIGGRGGKGGDGGKGAKGQKGSVVSDLYPETIAGVNGSVGQKGGDGLSCGTVNVVGNVRVFAFGGAGGAGGKGGAQSGWRRSTNGDSLGDYYVCAYEGGGGGGGGAGAAAADIGGGGSGGGGGAGGGSGAFGWFRTEYRVLAEDGYGLGGAGGKSLSEGGAGETGVSVEGQSFGEGEEYVRGYNNRDNTITGGKGESGGEPGVRGGYGTLNDPNVHALTEDPGYCVGRISETECILWKQGNLYRVMNGSESKLTYTTVDANTSQFSAGAWYVVKGAVSRGGIAVESGASAANLVLIDGASLLVQGADTQSGIRVSAGASFNVFGAGPGSVMAQGGAGGAGIGGGKGENGGTVKIYGGTVTATGGEWAAGIGGGSYGAGGTVTISGGIVTAAGGVAGAGIGGGYNEAGGTVTINGGKVSAIAGELATRIGRGAYGRNDGTIEISGGVFARPIREEWTAEGFAICANSDSVTSSAYPYAVMPAAFTVTISDHPHMTVQWTYGDGSVSNSVAGSSFKLGTGMTGVLVIFTPECDYRFADDSETGVRALASPVVADCVVSSPVVAGGTGSITAPWMVGDRVTAYVSDESALVIGGTGAMYDFASAADVPWAAVAKDLSAVTVEDGVTYVGKNAFAGMENLTSINGEDVKSTYRTVSTVNGKPIGQFNMMGGALGYAPLAYPSESPAQPSGAISGAEFDAVQIIDGKAYLDVSVYTSDTLANQNWSVATNGVIEVPAPGKQGFFYLMSKPAATSNLDLPPIVTVK